MTLIRRLLLLAACACAYGVVARQIDVVSPVAGKVSIILHLIIH